MRKEGWVALWVRGDGNCCWRSLAKCLWESDEYWSQLKLVVLAWAAAHAEELVSEGRVLSDFSLHFSDDIHAGLGYAYSATRVGAAPSVAQTSRMLLASVAYYCEDTVWGSDFTLLLASQALKITVKLLSPNDMMVRKRDESSATPGTIRGAGRKGDKVDDTRLSQTFLPDDAVSCLHIQGGGRMVAEATVVLTSCTGQASVGELDNLVEVTKSTACPRGVHFAAVSKKDRSTPPFPLVRAAPPLFQALVSRCRKSRMPAKLKEGGEAGELHMLVVCT